MQQAHSQHLAKQRKKPKAFTLKFGTRTGCSLFPSPFQYRKLLARTVRQVKDTKRIQNKRGGSLSILIFRYYDCILNKTPKQKETSFFL